MYYDNGRSRYMRKDTNSTSFAKTVTHYLGNVEYKYSGSDVKIKRHIGGLIIESTSHQNNRSTWTFNHLLKDHLGSTHTVVNKQGQSIQRFSFNAWGERRQPAAVISNGAIFNLIPIGLVWNNLGQDIEETTNRGFTGHEHFDQVGIIHMNGRIYDPTIGRFLQADPIIQDPYNTQSLNRYSYVMNNPLSFTDPSGYSRMRKGWWRMPVAIAITVFTAGAASGVMAMVNCVANSGTIIGQAFAISIAGGAAAGAVATGTLKGAVKGGLIAAVTFGIGHGATNATGAGVSPLSAGGKVVAHSIVSGVSAELDGGKFGHGFASTLMSMGADKIGLSQAKTFGGRIVSNAIVAGSISELTGGKFANGAMSEAFRVAYNDSLRGRNDWDSWIDPNLENKDDGGRPYFITDTVSDMHEGALSVPDDYFRVLWHYESLNGDYGIDSYLYALSADFTVTSALGAYANNEQITVGDKTFNFRSEVNNLVSEQISNNKAFFVGRTSYSVGQSLLLGRLRVPFSGKAAVGVPSFTVASFGRALNLYDQGITNATRLVSGAISGR